jgi:hypothetical protein
VDQPITLRPEFLKYPHLERFGTDEVDGVRV